MTPIKEKQKKYSIKTRNPDKMESNYELWMDILDFSCIPGFPHKYAIQNDGKELFPLF